MRFIVAKRRSSTGRPVLETLESRTLFTVAPIAPFQPVTVPSIAVSNNVPLGNFFSDPSPSPNVAFFTSQFGVIPVLLTPGTTPLTVANFLNYVNRGDYNNTIVHRSVPGFIFQAGGYQLQTNPNQIVPISADPPVANEFSASNVRGTIAMAKLGNDPNSATDEFFFNESDDNAANLDNQNGGFTVFGNVIGTQGLVVMDAIANVPVPSTPPFSSPLDEMPLVNYVSGNAVHADNFITFTSITTGGIGYAAVSDDPSVVTASVSGSTLTYNSISNGTAHITVTAVGADGMAASEILTVTVGAVVAPPTPAALTPVSSGVLPASVIAGQPAKILQTVKLNAAATPVDGPVTVLLTLSTSTTGTPSDFTLATFDKSLVVKANKHAVARLKATQVSADIPAAVYHVLVVVTDPTGTTTVDTGQTLTIIAPVLTLSESVTVVGLNPAVVGGAKTHAVARIAITDNGNIPSKGSHTIDISASTSQAFDPAGEIASLVKTLTIKPGITRIISIPLKTIPAIPDGDYFIVAQVTDPADSATSAATIGTTNIAAPFVSLAATFLPLPAKPLVSGATLLITNNGNSPDVTLLTEGAGFSSDPDGATPVGTSAGSGTPRRLHLLPGKSVKLHIGLWKLVASSLAPGTYFLTGTITDESANSVTAVSGPFSVT